MEAVPTVGTVRRGRRQRQLRAVDGAGVVRMLETSIGTDEPRAEFEPRLRGAAIAAIACAIPDLVVENRAIASQLGVSEGWILARTGIRERRRTAPSERLDDLAAEAGQRALEGAGVEPGEVDLVLVATTASEELIPSTAPLVAGRLGAVRAGAVDVGAACTGFVSALMLGAAQIESGRADCVLVVGADALSRYIDATDRRTAALFGDGAGAAVLCATAPPTAIGPVVLGADSSAAEHIVARHGGKIEMRGQDTYRDAVARLCDATIAAVHRHGLSIDQVDLFVYHQANARIVRAVGARLDLPADRIVDCIGRFGNTAAASLPIALCEAERAGRLYAGARVLVAACGAGFTWGGGVVEWGRA